MKNWLIKNGNGAGMLATALLAAGSLLIPAGLPARWVASALLILSLPPVWRRFAPLLVARLERRRADWRNLAARYLPYLAVTVGTLVSLYPISIGEPPVSQDHANHYLATHILVEDLIPSGRFFGWTDRIGSGYPFGDLYSTPAYLLTGLLHLVSFGAIALPASYAFGIVLVWLIPALATVAWTRRLAGPWGATLAGLALTLDVGGDREGGWTYAMFHGVWPQQLGVGLWLLALLALWRLAEHGTTRRLGVAVALCGLSLWVHPMNSLALLAGGALIFTLQLLGAPRDADPGADRGVLRLIVALGCGGVVGLVWVGRMMLAGDVLRAYPAYWEPLQQLLGRLLEGGPFDHQLALIAGLAVIGGVWLLRRGGRFRLFTLVMLASFLLVGSMELLSQLDLGLAGGKLGVMQYRRFSIPAKPLWYALAGAGLTVVGRGLIAGMANHRAVLRRLSYRVVVAVLLAPCLWALVTALPGLVRSPSSRPLTMERAGQVEQVAAVAALLEQETARRGSGLRRAVYWEKPGFGGRYPMFALADAGYGFLPTKIIPANNFSWVNWTRRIEDMSRLGVSVVISRWKQDHERLDHLGRHGVEHVYRVRGDIPSQVRVRGAGQAEIESWEPERRVIAVDGADAATSLVVSMPPYRKWHAVQDGRELPISPHQEGRLTLLQINDAKDGEIVLEYRDTTLENVLFALGLLVLLAALAGAVLRPRPLPSPFGDRALTTIHRLLAVVIGVVALLVVVAIGIASSESVDREWLSGEPGGAKVGAVLHRNAPQALSIRPRHHCVAALTRDPRWGCSEGDLEPQLIPAPRREGRIPSCLAVGIPPKGASDIRFALPAGTARLKGRLHLLDGNGVTASADLAPGGRSQKLALSSRGGKGFALSVGNGAESVAFRFKSKHKHAAQVCLEAVALSGGAR